MVAALQLLLYVLLDAVLQGRLTLRNRKYIPMSEQKGINLDLHFIAPALYLLYIYSVAGLDWRLWLLAVVLRLGLLDPIMNAVKGDPLFAVGSSALTDRLLRKLAGARATWLSGAVRVAAVAAAALLLSSCRTAQQPRDAEAAGPGVPVAAGNIAQLPTSAKTAPGNIAQLAPPAPDAPRRFFGPVPAKKPKAVESAKQIKYKNVTFTTVVGNDNQLQTVGKKSQAPVGQAAPNASLNQADSKTGIAQAGENLKADQKQAEVKPWYGFLLGPVGIALAVVVLAGAAYGFVQYRRARTII